MITYSEKKNCYIFKICIAERKLAFEVEKSIFSEKDDVPMLIKKALYNAINRNNA